MHHPLLSYIHIIFFNKRSIPLRTADIVLSTLNAFMYYTYIPEFLPLSACPQELVLEKESRIRETMKMMGLSNWTLVSTWFLKQLMFYFIPILIMVILLKVYIIVQFSVQIILCILHEQYYLFFFFLVWQDLPSKQPVSSSYNAHFLFNVCNSFLFLHQVCTVKVS